MIETIKTRIAELEAEQPRIQAALRASGNKLAEEQRTLAELTERARKGNLVNPASLAKAFQTVADIEAKHKTLEHESTERINAILEETATLVDRLATAEHARDRAAYYALVADYAKKAVPLLQQAEDIRRMAAKVCIAIEPEHVPSALLTEDAALIGGVHIRSLAG